MSRKPSINRSTPPPSRDLKAQRRAEGQGRHRSFVIFMWLMLGHLLVFGKLFYVQVIEGERWNKVAQQECVDLDRTPAPRGRILDRQGQVLAEEEGAYSLYVDPNLWSDVEKSQILSIATQAASPLKRLQEARLALTNIKITDNDKASEARDAKIREEANKKWSQADVALLPLAKTLAGLPTIARLKTFLPDTPIESIIVRNLRQVEDKQTKALKWRQISVAFRLPMATGEKILAEKMKGVGTVAGTRRVYPQGDIAPHILGTIGDDGRGRIGVESKFDREMAGAMGIVSAEFAQYYRDIKTPDGKKDKEAVRYRIPGSERINEPMVPGGDVKLTLDTTIQKYTEEALREVFETQEAEAAVAVVLAPKTGEILALSSYPAFTQAEINRYYQNAVVFGRVPAFPGLQNRAVSTPYEPGSTLKAVTIAAVLQENKVDPNTYSFFCPGKEPIGKDTIHCALHHPFENGHGTIGLTGILQHSCNLGTADCAFLLKKEKLYDYERLFGLTSAPQSGMPGESRGQLSPTSTWSQLKLANVSFGQGISATPLQVAAAYGVLASGGTYQHPHVIQEIRTTSPEGKVVRKSLRYGHSSWDVISPKVSQQVLQMLQTAVDHGTGSKAQLSDYTVAGKTGTAQIAENGHYNGKYVASFVGVTPVSKPELVILVAVTAPKKGHYGGEVAAPVFRKIAGQALPYMGVAPDKKPVAGQVGGVEKTVTSFAE
jgi:cell division protein FtsI/penicillin-binding protein 2